MDKSERSSVANGVLPKGELPDKIYVVVKTDPWTAADRWICGLSDPNHYGIVRATADDAKAEDAAIQNMRYEIARLQREKEDFPAELRLPDRRTNWVETETLYRACLAKYAAEMAGIFVMEVEIDLDELVEWFAPLAAHTGIKVEFA